MVSSRLARPRRPPRYSFAAAVFGLALGAAAPAFAGPEELAVAEKLFEQGQRDMAAGNYASACPRLAESRRIDPQIGVTLYLAECLQQTGKLASAWALFRDAAQASSAKNDNRAAIARKRSEALEPRLAMVTLKVPAEVEVAGLELLEDGAPVSRARWNVATPTDPGEHTITARAKGMKTWQKAYVVEREAQKIDVDVPRLEDAPEPPPGTGPRIGGEPRDATTDGNKPNRTLAYGLLGVSAVGIGIGTIFGIQAAGNASDVKGLCPAYPTCAANDAGRARELNDDARSQGAVSTIGIAVGAVALAAAIYFLVRQ